jgi:vacuolar-type H+-ATPase subunit C/Vma6
VRPAVSPYEALAAKARAMFGKRLRFDDYERMGRCSTELEVLDILRQIPSWAPAVEDLETSAGGYVGRVELEGALDRAYLREYQALAHYIPQADRELMRFPVLLAERDAILRTLRRLKAGTAGRAPESRASPLLRHSRMDMDTMELCRDYDELTTAAAGSIYAPVLQHLRPENGAALPDYMVTESLLRTAYFTHIYRVIHRHYTAETKDVLLRAFGRQIDLLNIIHILRIKTYFPQMQDLFKVLFPFNYRLSQEFLAALSAAPDAAAAFALVARSAYAESFSNVDVAEVEDYYRNALYVFNRQQLLTGEPCVYTAMSYLSLKETELRMLINVIESVKYGVPYDSAFARLIGA